MTAVFWCSNISKLWLLNSSHVAWTILLDFLSSSVLQLCHSRFLMECWASVDFMIAVWSSLCDGSAEKCNYCHSSSCRRRWSTKWLVEWKQYVRIVLDIIVPRIAFASRGNCRDVIWWQIILKASLFLIIRFISIPAVCACTLSHILAATTGRTVCLCISAWVYLQNWLNVDSSAVQFIGTILDSAASGNWKAKSSGNCTESADSMQSSHDGPFAPLL